MAVKLMVAPAIASGALEKTTGPARQRTTPSQPRPKTRRSSVYDAEGHEVFITLMCLKCQKMRPLSLFGLRKMADGAIRNQPWCRACRAAAGGGKSKGTLRAATETTETAGPPEAPGGERQAVAPAAGTGVRSVAAEVAAALAAGRR